MEYGYCRCSLNSDRQDINRQVRELQKKGILKRNMFTEYVSSKKVNRVELNRLLNTVSEGDCIYCTELSRITRSTKQLCEIITFAKEKKLKLVLGEFVLDCTQEKIDAMTQGMVLMIGVFAELERNILKERVISGIENARDKGKTLGRPKMTEEKISDAFIKNYLLYKERRINKKELARISNLSRPTVDKYINIMRG